MERKANWPRMDNRGIKKMEGKLLHLLERGDGSLASEVNAFSGQEWENIEGK